MARGLSGGRDGAWCTELQAVPVLDIALHTDPLWGCDHLDNAMGNRQNRPEAFAIEFAEMNISSKWITAASIEWIFPPVSHLFRRTSSKLFCWKLRPEVPKNL
jgi:hypothetical protein